MPAPQAILDLVNRFENNYDSYTSGQYNETQLRREFLDPFFQVLGWDIANEQGLAEAYKDVIHEDAIKIGSATKAPDYCFRVGGTRKFFLEAKKPSINLKEDVDPAFQLRRYAWSAKLPLSVLSDFEEFVVYDCRLKPAVGDKASISRIKYWTYKQYPECWDEIVAIFSKDAILKGSFDVFVQQTKGKHGTAAVDDAFLSDIDEWRKDLAQNLALRNPKLSQRDLNYAVQTTLDRIIFLRICEDRGLEDYGRLLGHINGEHVYKRLCETFRYADERYNSGLFHFQKEKDRPGLPDEFTLQLKIDDDHLHHIIKRLYYPESPYEFSVISADILGQVYEQFLGKVIRLTDGHHAKVEEKPEVKKAGGVYYTPKYIVDYIVENTVVKLLEGKTAKQAASLRILDPACGSGSFLIGAYQKLMDWHLEFYVKDGIGKWNSGKKQTICQSSNGAWRLTTLERKRILTNNIFGVDIDPQAVEVTKLSLLLKVLEGETSNTLSNQMRLFHERALPDLSDNIKCGNSLIGPDFYQEMLNLDDGEKYRVNAFDWQAEFKEIMKAGGFNAVIGNPPYIRVRIFKELYPKEASFLEMKYDCAKHIWDIYLLFYEKAITISCSCGYIGFILPIQTLHQTNCKSLRHLLVTGLSITTIADVSRLRVFQDAVVKNCILVSKKCLPKNNFINLYMPRSSQDLFEVPLRTWPQGEIDRNDYSLKMDILSPAKNLCAKIESESWRLSELCYVTFGLRSCAKGVGGGGKDRLITKNKNAEFAKPYLEGRDIRRYVLKSIGNYIRYIPEEMYSPRSPRLFETNKIVSQSMLSKKRLVATLDTANHYVEQSLICIIPHGLITKNISPADIPLEFILGIINSKLASYYYSCKIIDYSLGGGLIHATPGSQGKLPIPKGKSETQIAEIVEQVKEMIRLNNSMTNANVSHEKELIQRQIEATDIRIDQNIYLLYGLTDLEIRAINETE